MRTAVIADDQPITLMDLEQLLTEQGIKVAGTARDGFDAVELCRRHHPDVALLDVRMPVFDGLEAARTIVDEDLAGCVVLLTAYSDPELIARASEVGVAGYLVKPVSQRALLPAIEVALAQGERLRRARKEAAGAQKRLEDSAVIDRAREVLSKLEGITPGEAHKALLKLSMDKRRPLSEIALAVVSQHDERELITRAKAVLMASGMSEAEAYRYIKAQAAARGLPAGRLCRAVISEGGVLK